MTTNLDVWARDLLWQAWAALAATRTPGVAELQAMQAVMRLETFYGRGWHGVMGASKNWGAVQSTAHPNPDGSAPPGALWSVDTHPNPDGTSTSYRQLFRAYASDEEGCADVVRWFLAHTAVLDAAQTGDTAVFSSALYAARYYEGRGPSKADRIENHAGAVQKNAEALAASLGEPCVLQLHAFSFGPPGLPDLPLRSA